MGAADSWAQIGIVWFYPYRLSDPVLLLQVDSFEEDRVLSGAGILGVGHLCQYLCRQPEGRADKPEERDRVCSDSDSEKFLPMQAEPTCLFCMEGTKISIKSKLGDWNEIEMEDGNEDGCSAKTWKSFRICDL